MEAIETFKRRNMEKNMRGQFREEEQVAPPQVPEDEEHMHALEDFENMGHVINLQIGDKRGN